ncbi:glycosyltransferase family 2 protein [Sphingomonas sp. ID0503]|uniref:glycosyltransferase family 2 protein n=1 Tax=Sphingomonas sp. ID0503 TaxID=3399691 RepID=UPI003AFAC430
MKLSLTRHGLRGAQRLGNVPLISDAMLGRLVRAPVAAIRLAAARKAARRALHAVALTGAPEDAAVLALLGLHSDAAEAEGRDAEARAGVMVGRAALGALPTRGEARALPLEWQRRLAAVAAVHDPAFAAEVLGPGSDQAACLYAIGPGTAAPVLEDFEGRDVAAMRAGVMLTRGTFREARAALNAAFEADGLAGPLEISDEPLDIHTLNTLPPAVRAEPVEAPALALRQAQGERRGGDDAAETVSVIVPLHDNAATIQTALHSLLAQTHANLDIIVVDDRSRDDGPQRVASLADPRIRLIRNKGPRGAAAARNAGLAEARGTFIAFHDADDWAHPERIARQLGRMGSAGSVAGHFRMDEDGMPIAPRVFPFVRLCPISMLIRRQAFLAAGPFEEARTGSDAEMLARLDTFYGRGAIRRDPAILTVQLWRPGSLSNDGGMGLSSADRYAYRAAWMRRHAALWRAGGLPMAVPAS